MKTLKLHTGKRLQLTAPFGVSFPDGFDIKDVILPLSKIPRFCGHTVHGTPTVLQHSLAVEQLVSMADSDNVLRRLTALLHDASEAFMQDIPKPIKELLPDYQQLEANLMDEIGASLGIDGLYHRVHEDSIIEAADQAAYLCEEAAYRSSNPSKVCFSEHLTNCYEMERAAARKAFLVRFEHLLTAYEKPIA